MSVEIIEGERVGDDSGRLQAVITCSVSGWALGPVFDSAEEAQSFIDYARRVYEQDVRDLSDECLRGLHRAWLRLQVCACSGRGAS